VAYKVFTRFSGETSGLLLTAPPADLSQYWLLQERHDLHSGDSIGSKANVSHFQLFAQRRITKHECLDAGDCVCATSGHLG
jgi:hypothetical protein